VKAWEQRVRELEAEGCTRSDAQGVADVEASKGLVRSSGIGTMVLVPDVEEEWTPEQMEEAEEEVQAIIDQYYGQVMARKEGR